MSSRAKTTYVPEGLMILQETISAPDTLLKLYVAIGDWSG